MNCQDYEAMLPAYVDGELSEEDRGKLQEHLSGCPRCRAQLAELTALQEDLAMIMDSDVKTIRTDIKGYQQKYGVVVPTR